MPLLGERRGSTKVDHCPRCNQVVDYVLDHKLGWQCPNCDLDGGDR